MRKISKFVFTVILLLFITSSYSNSNDKIAYVDLDYLFNNSKEGKKIILKLNELKQKSVEEIKEKELNIINLEKDLNQKKNILSEEEFEKKLINLKQKVENFRKDKKNINIIFENEKKKQIKLFFDGVNPHVAKFMEQNQISIIIEKKNIFVGASKNDITKDILNLLNKN